MEPILGFFKSNGYFWLSNFEPCSIVLDGLEFSSSEAAYMAQKCAFAEDKFQFTGQLKGSDAKALGQKVKLRSDWEAYKVLAMTRAVYAKFNQNFELKCKLLATGSAHIEETNSWGDRFWGADIEGNGLNMLGNVLMYTREILQAPSLPNVKLK